MSTVTRLSRTQRCRYLSVERWASGELCFWRDRPGYNQKEYESILDKWIQSEQRNLKADNRNV